ncbi:ubiquitin-protein ligase E3A-like [Sycon ciliatum]|uniref:ubiquitin-protein ligase E3A-like n=1 Tax=Sycon ciliatum TaxID=27933 RepID=UPI0031F70281
MSTADNRRKEARERAERLVQAYHHRLAVGCGSVDCENENCRSSPHFRSVSSSELPKLAVELARRKAHLCSQLSGASSSSSTSTYCSTTSDSVSETCDQPVASAASKDDVPEPMDVGFPDDDESSDHACVVVDGSLARQGEQQEDESPAAADAESSSEQPQASRISPRALETDEVQSLAAAYRESGDAKHLHGRLFEAFSSWQILCTSFRKPATGQHLVQPEQSPMTQGESSDQPMEMDERRPQDHLVAGSSKVSVSMSSVRSAFSILNGLDEHSDVSGVIATSLDNLFADFRVKCQYDFLERLVDVDPTSLLDLTVILLELPWLMEPCFLEETLPKIVQFCSDLPTVFRMELARHMSCYSEEQLETIVSAIQQFVAFHIAMLDVTEDEFVPDHPIKHAIITLEVLYAAAVLGGEQRQRGAERAEAAAAATADAAPSSLGHDWPANLGSYLTFVSAEEKAQSGNARERSLMARLVTEQHDCKKPLVPFSSFVSEPLNSVLDQHMDYIHFRHHTFRFSVMRYPFLLSLEYKASILKVDCRLRQRLERGIFQLGNMLYITPYLKLQVRREHIMQDALVQLEIAASDDAESLKKQLYVEFEGEQGVDEGGVQKEFFQILIEQLFNADFGMFTYEETTRLFWFNPVSFENKSHFTLIGMLLGLALYNNVILDIHLPSVVYRKLMGISGSFDDLKDSHPGIASGLQQMLDYRGEDFVEIFDCTFNIGYQDVFGESLAHDLVPNGSEVMVTASNVKEYVTLYTDFLLNKMVAEQFDAFKKGFTVVTHKSNIIEWFLPDELELLICGRKTLDFDGFEANAAYDGYDKDTEIIRHFWEIVNSFNEENKRRLLSFCTGSDRVPIGGLKALNFTIVRSGPDSDRLPSAHTCFNTLLLPHYKDRDTLRTRLLIAISHAKGFGMV